MVVPSVLSRYPSLRLYLHPRVLAVLCLGFSSGLPLPLVLSTLTVWLTEAGVTRTSIGIFSLVTLPYAIKFLWSPLVDQMPLPLFSRYFGRRRGWMIFTQVVLMGSLIALGMADPSRYVLATAVLALIVAFASASQDIVIDAYRVELLEPHQQGAGAAVAVLGYRIGMLVSAAGALVLADFFGWFVAYAVMALFILPGVLTVWIAGEPKVLRKAVKKLSHKTSVMERLEHWVSYAVAEPFRDFISRPGAWFILLFILCYKLGDAYAGVMTNPFLIELGFSKVEIAEVVKLYGFAATVLGAFLGGAMVSRLGIIPCLWIGGILQMLSNLVFIWQAQAGHDVFVLAITMSAENFSGGFGTAAFVAYLSGLCNVQFTATQYALLSSLASVGRTVLSSTSGGFVDATGWVVFFLFTVVLAVPGLLMLLVAGRRSQESGVRSQGK